MKPINLNPHTLDKLYERGNEQRNIRSPFGQPVNTNPYDFQVIEERAARKNVAKILQAYLIAALWSSTDDEGDPLDDTYDIRDIDRKSVAEAKRDIGVFLRQAGEMADDWDEGQLGHDLWLTRNGHGAGFWDRKMPFADELSKIAEKMGEKFIYANDDGKVYID